MNLVRTKIFEYMLGIALFLFAIHNPYQPLIHYAFLPSLGVVLTVMIVYLYLVLYYKKITLGSPYYYIPMAVISGSIAISAIINGNGLGTVLWAISLFGLYLVARITGTRIFVPFTYGMILSVVGLIVWGIINPGAKSGGYLISTTNYDIIVGVLVIGTLVSAWQKRWWLSAIAITGLLISGSEEGLFLIFVMLIVSLVRKDWSVKALLPYGIALLALIVATSAGFFNSTANKAALAKELIINDSNYVTQYGEVIDYNNQELIEIEPITRNEAMNIITGYRWSYYWNLSSIKPFGYGYNMTNYYTGIPHNVVLIIIEQIGILPALAWVFLMVYCAIKTKWKYAFIAVLALGVFDHFIWTQIGVWPIAMVGVASASNIKNDLIFRRVEDEPQIAV